MASWLAKMTGLGPSVALLVLGASALDLSIALRPSPSPVGSAAMSAAGEAITRLRRPGDIVVHSPLFSIAELQALGSAVATTPHRPSSSLMKTRRVLTLERRGHAMFGFDAPSSIIPVEGSGGELEIRVYEPERAGEIVIYELRESIGPDTARVERPLGRVSSRCAQVRDDGAYGCPGEPEWIYAGPRSLRIGGEEVQCVWAHPTNDGAVVFEIPGQAPPRAGHRLRLALSAGLTDEAVRLTGDGAAVSTDIVQAGLERGRLVVPNRIGFQRTVVHVEPGAPLELRITTPRDGRRHHCLNAEILDVEDRVPSSPEETGP